MDEQRLELGVLLAAEAAARVRGEDSHLGQREVEEVGHHALQQVGVLHRAPQAQAAVRVRGGDEAVRLDGEVGDHREGVGALHDDVGRGLVDVPPGEEALAQYVRRRERVILHPDRRLLHQRGVRRERVGEGDDGRQLLVLDAHKVGGPLGGVLGLRHDSRDRLPVVLRLLQGDHRAVLERWAEALRRQVGGGHDVQDAGDFPGR